MLDEDDEPYGFTRPAWRRVIRSPLTRPALRRSRRHAACRRWVRLWGRAATDPERRPTYHGE